MLYFKLQTANVELQFMCEKKKFLGEGRGVRTVGVRNIKK